MPERFIGNLIEQYAGAFPVWISPVQVKILPITDKEHEYAEKLRQKFEEVGIRVEVDSRNEKTGYKIREAQLEKVPYMLVVGPKEVEANSVSVRSRENGDEGSMEVEKFQERILEEIINKK